MRNKTFDGVVCALITPFDKNGLIDIQKLRDHTNHVIENGVHSVLALGGSGQYWNMDCAQREIGIKAVIEVAAGRVPVLAPVLNPGLGDTIEQGKMWIAAGADALLILPPHNVVVTQQGIYDYYKLLAKELNYPIFTYNYPQQHGTNIQPETLARMFREIPNIVGVKECTEYGQFLSLMRLVGDDATVLAGNQIMFADMVAAGAKGGIIAIPCLLPREFRDMYELAKAGKIEKAREILYRCIDLMKATFDDGLHPASLKYALTLSGQDAGEYYPPLAEPCEERKQRIHRELKKLGMLAQ